MKPPWSRSGFTAVSPPAAGFAADLSSIPQERGAAGPRWCSTNLFEGLGGGTSHPRGYQGRDRAPPAILGGPRLPPRRPQGLQPPKPPACGCRGPPAPCCLPQQHPGLELCCPLVGRFSPKSCTKCLEFAPFSSLQTQAGLGWSFPAWCWQQRVADEGRGDVCGHGMGTGMSWTCCLGGLMVTGGESRAGGCSIGSLTKAVANKKQCFSSDSTRLFSYERSSQAGRRQQTAGTATASKPFNRQKLTGSF